MRLLCMAIFVVLFLGFQFPSSETSLLAADYSKPQGWDQLVEAAGKEGNVTFYGRRGGQTEEVLGDFEKAYPDIKIRRLFLPGGALLSRIMAEYRARMYIVDVLIGGNALIRRGSKLLDTTMKNGKDRILQGGETFRRRG